MDAMADAALVHYKVLYNRTELKADDHAREMYQYICNQVKTIPKRRDRLNTFMSIMTTIYLKFAYAEGKQALFEYQVRRVDSEDYDEMFFTPDAGERDAAKHRRDATTDGDDNDDDNDDDARAKKIPRSDTDVVPETVLPDGDGIIRKSSRDWFTTNPVVRKDVGEIANHNMRLLISSWSPHRVTLDGYLRIVAQALRNVLASAVIHVHTRDAV